MKIEHNRSYQYVVRSLKTENFRSCVQALSDEDLKWALLFISKKNHGTKRNVSHQVQVDASGELKALARQEAFLRYIRKELENRKLANFSVT